MAKAHKYTTMSLWIMDKAQILTNSVRLRCNVEFTVKHDGDAVSTDHRATIDIKTTLTRIFELAMKTIVIHLQNKKLRPLTRDAAKAWLKEHDPVDYDALYATTTKVIVKEPTDREMYEALVKKYGSLDEAKLAMKQESEEE